MSNTAVAPNLEAVKKKILWLLLWRSIGFLTLMIDLPKGFSIEQVVEALDELQKEGKISQYELPGGTKLFRRKYLLGFIPY